MHRTLAWGILGTGRIARRFAVELPHAQWGRLVAVGSRTQAAADAFAAEFPILRAHGSYDELLADPDVDAVYVSLPNHLHAHWAIRCAEAGKHILCEKPLTTDHPEAMTVVEAARANDVFLMEAFMYRCHPQIAQLQEAIGAGAIGEVRLIQAYFGYNMGGHNDDIRLQSAFAGGGIMDVGCYPISIVRLIAGAACGQPFANPIIESDGYRSVMALKAYGHIGAESQVDEWTTATLKSPGTYWRKWRAACNCGSTATSRSGDQRGTLWCATLGCPTPTATKAIRASASWYTRTTGPNPWSWRCGARSRCTPSRPTPWRNMSAHARPRPCRGPTAWATC